MVVVVKSLWSANVFLCICLHVGKWRRKHWMLTSHIEHRPTLPKFPAATHWPTACLVHTEPDGPDASEQRDLNSYYRTYLCSAFFACIFIFLIVIVEFSSASRNSLRGQPADWCWMLQMKIVSSDARYAFCNGSQPLQLSKHNWRKCLSCPTSEISMNSGTKDVHSTTQWWWCTPKGGTMARNQNVARKSTMSDMLVDRNPLLWSGEKWSAVMVGVWQTSTQGLGIKLKEILVSSVAYRMPIKLNVF